jgi:Lysine-2,3-aminomutase
VPINPGYVLFHDHEKIVIRNYEGKIFEYPEQDQPVTSFRVQEPVDEFLFS